MNVTVPKQTQGATFGEKVAVGLQSGANALSQGASRIVIECGQDACALVFPDDRGYRAYFNRMNLQTLPPAQASAVRKGPLANGASLLGGALPGGAVISAAVSSVSSLAGGGSGAAAASYAATGRMSGEGTPLRASLNPQGEVDVLDPLVDGDYRLTIVVERPIRAIKDTLKTQVRATAAQPLRIEVGFKVEAGVINPLLEGNGNSGDNPLFEAASDRK